MGNDLPIEETFEMLRGGERFDKNMYVIAEVEDPQKRVKVFFCSNLNYRVETRVYFICNIRSPLNILIGWQTNTMQKLGPENSGGQRSGTSHILCRTCEKLSHSGQWTNGDKPQNMIIFSK